MRVRLHDGAVISAGKATLKGRRRVSLSCKTTTEAFKSSTAFSSVIMAGRCLHVNLKEMMKWM